MIPVLAKAIDHVSLRLATIRVGAHRAPSGDKKGQDSPAPSSEVLSTLEQWGNAPGIFFAPPANIPDLTTSSKRIGGDGRHERYFFRFESGHGSPWPRNNQVNGWMFLRQPDSLRRPTVVILHGWNHGGWQFFYYDFLCRWWMRRGINSVLFELPFHGRRRPRTPGAPDNFLTGDLPGSIRSVQQAVSDTRQLLHALWAAGYENVGLWGISLGGWIGGLTLALEERLAFAALTTPAARIDEIVASLPFAETLRKNLDAGGIPLSVAAQKIKFLLPVSHKPRLDPSKIFLMSALHDRFVSPASVEELAEQWQCPHFHVYLHGHISVLISPRALSELTCFFEGQKEIARDSRVT